MTDRIKKLTDLTLAGEMYVKVKKPSLIGMIFSFPSVSET